MNQLLLIRMILQAKEKRYRRTQLKDNAPREKFLTLKNALELYVEIIFHKSKAD